MSATFFKRILANKQEKVEWQRRGTDPGALRERALRVRRNAGNRRLKNALSGDSGTKIIAEIKRASPSKGAIADDVDVVELAKTYRAGGAAAISVLTEEDFFSGSLQDLIDVRSAVDLPILRKDFFIDEIQIYESASAGADAILLIVAALTETELKRLLRLAQDDLGIDAVVEAHTIDELLVAARVGADVIGMNNRDLHSFEVSLDVSRRSIAHRPPGAVMIAESGISTREEIEELTRLGFDGFLIGETLMRSRDPEAALISLTGGRK